MSSEARRDTALAALREAVECGSSGDEQRKLLTAIVDGIVVDFATEDDRNLTCIHLPMLVGAACGARPDDTAQVAAACVTLYAGARLLDDLMDGHHPSYFEHIPPAELVLGGATMLGALGYHALTSLPLSAARRVALCRTLSAGAVRMSAAAQHEAALADEAGSVDDVLAVADGKSGAMLSAFASTGAICAGAPRRALRLSAQLGRSLGIARQLAADLAELSHADPDVPHHPESLALPSALLREDADLPASAAFALAQVHVQLAIAEATVAVHGLTADDALRDALLSIVDLNRPATNGRTRCAEPVPT
jgi:geranylgeranyl pyrophosphate synthase